MTFGYSALYAVHELVMFKNSNSRNRNSYQWITRQLTTSVPWQSAWRTNTESHHRDWNWGISNSMTWTWCSPAWPELRTNSAIFMASFPLLQASHNLRSLHQQQSCADMQPQVSEQQTRVQLTQETHWPVYSSTWKENDPLHPHAHTSTQLVSRHSTRQNEKQAYDWIGDRACLCVVCRVCCKKNVWKPH